MKKYRLLISDQAVDDLMDIWLYIADDNVVAADDYVERVHRACEKLCLAPLIGRLRAELAKGMRSFPFENYIIFYRVRKDIVEIARVLSGYRDLDSLF